MKKHMQDRSIDAAATGSPRDILKLAYREGYIIDDKIWLDMLEDKNTMEHQYDDEVSKDILEKIGTVYLPEFERLVSHLTSLSTSYFE